MSSTTSLFHLLTDYRQAYFNGQPKVSDLEYDDLEAQLRDQDPDHPFFQEVGHPVPEKLAVPLPVWMGSLDKRKGDDARNAKALNQWIEKSPETPFVVSEKLDGVSLLLYWNADYATYHCYTRGNGHQGVDVTDTLLAALAPPSLEDHVTENILIRGEVILPRASLPQLETKTTNLRSIVNGIITAKHPNPKVRAHARFVAYAIPGLAPAEAFAYLDAWGFHTPRHTALPKDTASVDTLTQMLQDWKTASPYEIDGLVVARDLAEPPVPGKNPKQTVAFKTTYATDSAVTTVLSVEWNPSKDGYLKPRIHFEPVQLGGHTVQWATGYNAKYILQNRINTGAQVRIVRSGDVIPKVIEVLQSAPTLATPAYECTWTPSKVDLVLVQSDTPQAATTTLQYFLKTLGAKYMSVASVKRFLKESPNPEHLHPIELLLSSEPNPQSSTYKMESKQRASLVAALDGATPESLMAATNIFGRGLGVKRLALIIQATTQSATPPYQLVQRVTDSKLQNNLQYTVAQIPSFSQTLASLYVKGLEDFHKLLEASPNLAACWEKCLHTHTQAQSHAHSQAQNQSHHTPKPLAHLSFLETGKRDKALRAQLEALGARFTSSLSKSTNHLLYTLDAMGNSKYEKALGFRESMLPEKAEHYMMTPDECREWLKGF